VVLVFGRQKACVYKAVLFLQTFSFVRLTVRMFYSINLHTTVVFASAGLTQVAPQQLKKNSAAVTSATERY
jgi:hypothetical protein